MTLDEMPDRARLWVYTANRDLSESEQAELKAGMAEFLAGWSAHGAALLAAADLLYGRVLVVGLDEAQAGATGCSIDKLVGWVQDHGGQRGIDWMDRHQVLWREPGAQQWSTGRTPEFWALRKAGQVHGATEVVDPLAVSVGQAKGGAGWLVKTFDESWHAEMWS